MNLPCLFLLWLSLASADSARITLTESGLFDGGKIFLDVEGGATLPDGSWYASDKLSFRLFHLSPAGTPLGETGRRGSGQGEFAGPGPIAVQGSRVAVADFGLSRIQLFTGRLRFERSFHAPGSVFDLQFDDTGGLWVASHGERITTILARYDDKGEETLRIRPHGASGDLFGDVFRFTSCGNGFLCLAYMTQNLIEVWKRDGTFVRSFSVPGLPPRSQVRKVRMGSTSASLALPAGNIFRSLGSDPAGRLYLLGEDYSDHPLQDLYLMDLQGRLLATILLPVRSTCIWIGPDGSLFAVTGNRDTVRKYTLRFLKESTHD